ncbi:MAG: hypothetical protein IJK46_12170 [Prevotella sp.]|nr:hypothetical protein [Prevotella sp.]
MDTNTEQLSIIAEGWLHKDTPTFDELSTSILQTHQSAQANAIKAVNQMATLRNWLIGCYIVEYEQKGSDRARYGERLLKRLEERVNTKGLNETLFRNARTFYQIYPQVSLLFEKSATSSHKLATGIHPMPSDELETLPAIIHPTASDEFITSPKSLVEKLSFSHITEIMTQKDPLARFFYETECIKGTWSVKELRRQISTNLYFRSGVSKNPQRLLSTIKSETNTPVLTIRQPFTFEFVGLNANYPTRRR